MAGPEIISKQPENDMLGCDLNYYNIHAYIAWVVDIVFYMIMPDTNMFYGQIPQDMQAALNWNVSLIRSNELTKKTGSQHVTI